MWIPQSRQLHVRCFFPLHSLLPCAPATPFGEPFHLRWRCPPQALPHWPEHPPSHERGTSKSFSHPGLRRRSSSPWKPAPTPIMPKCLEAGAAMGWQGPAQDIGAATSRGWQRGVQACQEEQQEEGYRQPVLKAPVLELTSPQQNAAKRCLCCLQPSSMGHLCGTG